LHCADVISHQKRTRSKKKVTCYICFGHEQEKEQQKISTYLSVDKHRRRMRKRKKGWKRPNATVR
jgi:hypothetical protein